MKKTILLALCLVSLIGAANCVHSRLQILRQLVVYERTPIEVIRIRKNGREARRLDLIPSFLCRLPRENAAAAALWIVDELLPKMHKRKAAPFAGRGYGNDPRPRPSRQSVHQCVV